VVTYTINIFRDKWLDLPPLWTRNSCESKINISKKPTNAILKLNIKEVGWYDIYGGKHVEDSLINKWLSVEVNGQPVIDIRPSIRSGETYSANITAYLNAPYDDTFRVFIGVEYGWVESVRVYVIFDMWIEAEYPEGEEAPEVIVKSEFGGSGQSVDNIILLIIALIQNLPYILLMILLMKVMFTLFSGED